MRGPCDSHLNKSFSSVQIKLNSDTHSRETCALQRKGCPDRVPTGKTALSGKHKDFGNFVKTPGKFVKILGILCAKILNSLILKIKDITLSATKVSNEIIKNVRHAQ